MREAPPNLTIEPSPRLGSLDDTNDRVLDTFDETQIKTDSQILVGTGPPPRTRIERRGEAQTSPPYGSPNLRQCLFAWNGLHASGANILDAAAHLRNPQIVNPSCLGRI